MVVLAVFYDLPTAYVARSKLEACGISCYLDNEFLVGVQPLYANALHGIRLLVDPADVETARELLSDNLAPEALLPEDAALAPELETALFEPEAVCPRCGGTDARRIKLVKLLLLLTVFTGLPARSSRLLYRCADCGRIWREPETK